MSDAGLIVAGLGCRRGCRAAELEQLLRAALASLQLPLDALGALASSAHKRHEPGLLQLAAQLRLPLLWCNEQQLQAQAGQLLSDSAATRLGLPAVAEASALAAASLRSGRPARLLLGKQRSASATLALAQALANP